MTKNFLEDESPTLIKENTYFKSKTEINVYSNLLKFIHTPYFLPYDCRKYILVGKQISISTSQLIFPSSKWTTETLEKGVKYVQSDQ